jgi:glycosyltransferase 2 family protein
MTLARCMVLMAASMVGSMVQLPVIGWFTQIGVTTGVMQQVFHVQFEPALACGAMLLIVTFMCVIPFGLIWARVEHVSLKKVSEQSEHFSQEEAEGAPAISEA